MNTETPEAKKTDSNKAILPAFQALVVTGELAFVCLIAGAFFPNFKNQILLQIMLSPDAESFRDLQLPVITEYLVTFGKATTTYPLITFAALVAICCVLWIVLKIRKPKNPFAEAVLLLGSSFFVTLFAFGLMLTAAFAPLSQILPHTTIEEAIEVAKQKKLNRAPSPQTPASPVTPQEKQPASPENPFVAPWNRTDSQPKTPSSPEVRTVTSPPSPPAESSTASPSPEPSPQTPSSVEPEVTDENKK